MFYTNWTTVRNCSGPSLFCLSSSTVSRHSFSISSVWLLRIYFILFSFLAGDFSFGIRFSSCVRAFFQLLLDYFVDSSPVISTEKQVTCIEMYGNSHACSILAFRAFALVSLKICSLRKSQFTTTDVLVCVRARVCVCRFSHHFSFHRFRRTHSSHFGCAISLKTLANGSNDILLFYETHIKSASVHMNLCTRK